MSGTRASKGELLLSMRGIRIEAKGRSGWQEIVHSIDIDLRCGEVLGLIGESGAGKSTLGLAAMGFAREGCRITGGEVLFRGTDLLSLNEASLRKLRGSKIAYVAQSAATSFNPAHRLIAQCTEVPVQAGLQDAAEAEKNVIELFRMTQLPYPETIGMRYPHQVSGGQMQRMMTAMAMICRPSLIIFDEPTTALDVTTQVEVLAAIKDLVETFDTAAIYISHDLAVVAQMADRIAVLRHGRTVEENNTRSLLHSDDCHPYTRELIRARRFSQPSKVLADGTPLLELKDISASYGSVNVLEGISLSVCHKGTTAIVGESGSGKSTTARIVSGLLKHTAGKVLWKGEPLNPDCLKRPREQLRRIQYVHQSPDGSLNPKHTVRTTVGRPLRYFLGLKGDALEVRIRELLRLIELDPDTYIDRLPMQLSGGQKQRVCIARALAADPDLIICDEATSALDPLVADSILRLLSRLQEELSLAYLVITHDIDVVRAIADEVVVMHKGRVVESGSKNEVLDNAVHPYTKLLLSSVPELQLGWLDKVRSTHLERRAQIEQVTVNDL